MRDTDEMIIQQIRTGDTEAFADLLSRYQKRVFTFIYRMVLSEDDARDLTQEVFLQVFRSLDRFRGDARFSTWLYRISSNKTLDFLRRKRAKTSFCSPVMTDINDLAAAGSLDTNPELIYLQEEKIRRLRRLIAGLPDRYRVALVLFHYENLSYQQIAEALDLPVKTVATRLYRAKLILKERLGGETDGMP